MAIFHLFFYDRSCSLQKLLADLGVNAILVITLAKHCSYIYNLDSYCFKIVTLNSPRGGKKYSNGSSMVCSHRQDDGQPRWGSDY